MYDAVLALCEAIVYRYSYTGQVSRPTGNGHPALSPFDLFPTADGACAIAAPTDNHWALLCEIIGRPELIDDDRTRTNRERVANAGFVRGTLSAWTSPRTTAEVVDDARRAGPGRAGADGRRHLRRPPRRGPRCWSRSTQPDGSRPVVLPGTPIKLTATPAGVYRRPPRLGEHTAEVLAEVGL